MLGKKSLKVNFFLPLLLILLLPFLNYTQQEERIEQAQLTRDHSLFPLQSTGIWTEVHPLIPRVDYWGVHFVNADTGWAVGVGGAIIKTTNGGVKWIWYESGVGNTLRTVYAVNNGQRVIAAGDGGKIVISEDAGETWSQLSSPTTRNIWNMQMLTEEIGWMVGEVGTALKTTNGGLSWIQQSMPFPNAPYWDLSFINSSFGYICSSSGIVLKTTNGGGNWNIQQAGDTRSIYTIYAFDTLKASAGGFAGKVVYTTDGGINWLTSGGGISAAEINKIKFMDDAKGFLASSGGFYKSTNSGASWVSIQDLKVSGIVPITTNLSCPTESEGYVTGDKMLIAKSNNTGESWRKTIVNTDFINVYFKNEQEGFINSDNLIYTTKDAGNTLDTLLTFPYGNIYSLEGMTFTDSLTGYAGTLPTHIYKTINGGQNWYRTNIIGLTDTGGVIKKFYFLTYNTGWAIKGNQIMKTTDSGESWFVQQNIPGSLTSIFFIDSLNGWATNNSIMPFKTTNGGESWIEQINSNIHLSRDVYFKNLLEGYMYGYMVGVGSGIYQTYDGGITWSLDSSFIETGWVKFSNYDTNNIFITGTKVFRTTDGGNYWEEFPELQGQGLVTDYLWAINSGYFIGKTGFIIKYFDESVPVELINFEGWLNENETLLHWTTVTEINNKGFYIQRKMLGEIEWSEINFIGGKGNSTELNSYFYKDILREAGAYFYRLKQVDFNGAYEYSKEIEINFISPSRFKIMPNFPNPFNPTTNIRIILPEESIITIKLFNTLGELVKYILSKELQAGIFDIEINLSELPSGVYLYNVIAKTKTGNIYSKSSKLVLTK
jgi:photosystem II stability/assembly factor-like uncharacterized protein